MELATRPIALILGLSSIVAVISSVAPDGFPAQRPAPSQRLRPLIAIAGSSPCVSSEVGLSSKAAIMVPHKRGPCARGRATPSPRISILFQASICTELAPRADGNSSSECKKRWDISTYIWPRSPPSTSSAAVGPCPYMGSILITSIPKTETGP